MPTTNTTILFGKNALELRTDFTVTVIAGGEQPLALAADLANENPQAKYATFEPDYWKLDGTFHFPVDEASVGYMSTGISDASGNFATPPKLKFDFGSVHSTDGLTLNFAQLTDDYADDITVAFYDSAASLIRTDNYNPSSWKFSTGQAVANFKRVDITFNGTNNPYRMARLINLDFDTLTRWTGSDIKKANLIEQVNPLSIELPINQLEFSLFSMDADFSVLNPSNEFAALQHNEPIEAYEDIDGSSVFLGRFYLDEWESLSEHEATFSALDAISLLDADTFYCPFFSFDTAADHLIDNILNTRPIRDDMAESNSFTSAVTSRSWSHTCVGENRLLIVTLWLENSITLTAATYGGVNMTELGSATNGNPRIRVFYLINPLLGTNTVSLTWTTSRKCVAKSISFFNVDQTTPVGALFSATGTTETSSSITVTDATDKSIIYQNMFVYNGANTNIPTFSPSGEWGELNELYISTSTYQDGGAGKAGTSRNNYKYRNGDYNMTTTSITNGTNFINVALAIYAANPAPDIDYELDPSFLNLQLWYSANSRGELPSMTRREALQQVCFAIGAYVTCARSRTLKILPFKIIDAATGIYDQTLDETHKGLDSPTQLRKAMTALDIAANRYEWSSTDVQSLYSRTLGVGIYTITVDASVVNLDYSSSTATYIIIDDGLWWVKVQILVAGTFVIESFFSSSRVSERKFIINDIVPPKTPANVLTISNALLLTPENSGVVKSDFVLPAIQHVYSYYLQRVSQKTRLFGLNASAGDSVAIDAQGDTVYGMIERAEFDLTGGFVAQIEIVGDVDRSAQSVKYNNSSSKFTYNGFPNTNSDAQHYGGDIRYSSNGTTGNVQFYFIGYQFKFIYRQFAGGGEGSVGIYVDDVLATTIDQNGTTVYQKEWTSPVYANTYHKVKVQKVGTTGTANIDAVEVFYK